MTSGLPAPLMDQIHQKGNIDFQSVEGIRSHIAKTGGVTAAIAADLCRLSHLYADKPNDHSWRGFFLEEMTEFFETELIEPDTGFGDHAIEFWDSHLAGPRKPVPFALDLLMELLRKSRINHPDFLRLVRDEISQAVLENGKITAGDVELISAVIYGWGGSSGAEVDRIEADWLFDLHHAVFQADNHFSWTGLMVEAITKHILQDSSSPGEWDEEEVKWLNGRINQNGVVDELENAIIQNIERVLKEGPLAGIKITKLDDFLGKPQKFGD